MPPFLDEGLETVAEHCRPKNHAVPELRLGDAALRLALIFPRIGIAAPVRMALQAEIIEGAAHVHFFTRRHVEQRQVDGAAPAVPGFCGDIAFLEEYVLGLVRVKIRLHACVFQILRPPHKMADRHLRTIGVIDLQTVALRHHVVRHRLQSRRRFPRHQHAWRFVAVDPVADEIVGGIVANFQNHVGHGFRQFHEPGRIVGGNALPRPGIRRASHRRERKDQRRPQRRK